MHATLLRAVAISTVAAAIVAIAWFGSQPPPARSEEPAAGAKPAAAGSLADDRRIGKISDTQGIVVLKPVLAPRWSAVEPDTLLMPQDWLRTDVRGANAARLRTTSGVELTIGPGTLIELISPTQARLHTGEVQVNLPEDKRAPAKKPQPKGAPEQADAKAVAFELLGPREGSRKFSKPGKQFLRLDRNEQPVEIEELPPWLAGFESTASNPSLGSLIVNLPDGRNERLSIGYHKVSVEIRDQIARTTIEESFANHTFGRLEGVFHFPLPADASVSDFGMWIGERLVESDVVEKQRAREIFETILRERRDPALLEWTAGNLFKARVFPIEPQSEKRVKLVYTQVLPLRDGEYRYTYALRSDLLRSNPVRELSLSVTINSALPIKSVRCPTHATRVQQTPHAAQLEFAAQEYTPNRDFEVLCQIDRQQPEVVVVPHRRGSDGYLLLQLTPPAPEGNWRRELLAEGPPLDLVLLCDTSGSIDSEKRKQQADFVSAMLALLGERDRFLLAACDVSTVWAMAEPAAPTADNVARARDFLERRDSLGWTDLDQAFAAIYEHAPKHAHVVYIGDGIVSEGDHNPVSFVNRLTKRQAQNQAAELTLHSVAIGNTHEATVLQGIAAAGRGSTRAIGSGQTATAAAQELLAEITQPSLSNLEVEFRGLQIAALYPRRLPNLPAGTQQILVGRFASDGKDQEGEVVVTGRRGKEPVRYASKISIPAAEEGNSFIPRLWARSHLDYLLAQGDNPATRNDIIALSQEFHIITPYTSLLVLENDADRARFGVKRSFGMRDGEGFFAAGKADANFALAQQQAKKAASWRLGLQQKILHELETQDRDNRLFRSMPDTIDLERARARRRDGYSQRDNRDSAIQPGIVRIDAMPGEYDPYRYQTFSTYSSAIALGFLTPDRPGEESDTPTADVGGGILGAAAAGPAKTRKARANRRSSDEDEPAADDDFDEPDDLDKRLNVNTMGGNDNVPSSAEPQSIASDDSDGAEGGAEYAASEGLPQQPARASGNAIGDIRSELKALRDSGAERSRQALMSACMIPRMIRYFPDDFGFEKLPPAPGEWGQPQRPTGWTPAAFELCLSLLRRDTLRAAVGGIELRCIDDSFEAGWAQPTSQRGSLVLYSRKDWLTRPIAGNEGTPVNFCRGEQRGEFSPAYLLGQRRAASKRDFDTPPFEMNDFSLTPLYATGYPTDRARVEPDGEDRAILVVSNKYARFEKRYLIDTARHVLVSGEQFKDEQSNGKTTFSDFVQVGGSWWARKQVVTDSAGRKLHETRLEITALGQDAFDKRLQAELAVLPDVQFLENPLPSVSHARQRVADGAADFTERLVLFAHYRNVQQWDEAFAELTAAEKLAADKPGIRWLHTFALAAGRRHDETSRRLLDEARRLVANPQPEELVLAKAIVSCTDPFRPDALRLDLIKVLEPLADRQPPELRAKEWWLTVLADTDSHLNRSEESLAIRKRLVEGMPWNAEARSQYVYYLGSSGQHAAAREWLKQLLSQPDARSNAADETLRHEYAELLGKQAAWAELKQFVKTWFEEKPQSTQASEAYLSTLRDDEQPEAADLLVEQWLKEAQVEGRLGPERRARLKVALDWAHKSAYSSHSSRLDRRWVAPLTNASLFFARQGRIDLAREAIGWLRDETDDFAPLRGKFFDLLRTGAKELSPEQVEFLVEQCQSGRLEFAEPIDGRQQWSASEVPAGLWKEIADSLRARWAQAPDESTKNTLAEALESIYRKRFADSELLPFLRLRIEAADPDSRDLCTADLFETLLKAAWTDDVEIEVFQLLPKLAVAAEPATRQSLQTAALYRSVDAMLRGRKARAVRELRDKGNLDKLTRAELAKKHAELRQAARRGLAKRLADQAAMLRQQRSPLADWVSIELARLNARLGEQRDETLAFCWEILGAAPPNHEPRTIVTHDDLATPEAKQAALDALLRRRALGTAVNLITRKTADPADADRLLRYIDAGIAGGGDATTAWRRTKYQLLVALDRADSLEKSLHEWIRTDRSLAPWRQSLALLLAERGKLDEAIGLFESAAQDHLLSADDYWTLADWYQAQNRRSEYEQAMRQALREMPQDDLSHIVGAIGQSQRRGGNGQPPAELSEITVLALKALFEKSDHPDYSIGTLSRFYAASHDFRLMQMTPEVLLGRTPDEVEAVLNQLQRLVGEIKDEAAAEQLVARIKQLRREDRTAAELRALDLYEMLVERQSSGLVNQAGPHVEACLAAMRRAELREWSQKESPAMARLLVQLGTLPRPELKEEQLRQLRALQSAAPANSRDQLRITADLCGLLYRNYHRSDEALQMLEAALRSQEQAQPKGRGEENKQIVGQLVQMLASSGRYAAAEQVLRKQGKESATPAQKLWLKNRLWQLYNQALERGGEVSLGKGKALAQALIELGFRQLDGDRSDLLPAKGADQGEKQKAAPAKAPATELASVVEMDDDDGEMFFDADYDDPRGGDVKNLLQTFKVAHDKQLADVAEPLRKLAFVTMSEALKHYGDEYRYGEATSEPLGLIRDILGPMDELRYVVERMEQWPKRLASNHQDAWSHFGHKLAEVRVAVAQGSARAVRRRRPAAADAEPDATKPDAKVAVNPQYKKIEPRVLALVLAELRMHLEKGKLGNYQIFEYASSSEFWHEKLDEFVRLAHEVYQENRTSGTTAARCGAYLWSIDRYDDALKILLAAESDGVLAFKDKEEFLQRHYFGPRLVELLPLIEPMVRTNPNSIDARRWLMNAYFKAGKQKELQQLVQQTDQHFHAGGRWTEKNIRTFALACRECKEYERAVGYYHECIAERRRKKPEPGEQPGILSGMYYALSRAELALGHTKSAVDAAAAAIVSCPPEKYQLDSAISNLKELLTKAPDLDAFVRSLDDDARRTGQDSPLVRKALGRVYQEQKNFEQAIAQFEIAQQLQSNDKECCQALIQCYEALQKPDKANRQFHKLIDASPRNLQLYLQLAKRLSGETEAERAATSIIEAAPDEAENHWVLAEHREQQDRWNEAIDEWKQVAQLRASQPAGLIGLAGAQAHQKKWDALRKTLDTLKSTAWPAEFANELEQVESIREQLPK